MRGWDSCGYHIECLLKQRKASLVLFEIFDLIEFWGVIIISVGIIISRSVIIHIS